MNRGRKESRSPFVQAAVFLILLLAVTLLAPVRCLAADLSGEEDGSETARAEEMLEEELDFDAINETLEEIFPEEKMDFGETVRSIVTGDLSVSVDLLGQLYQTSFSTHCR